MLARGIGTLVLCTFTGDLGLGASPPREKKLGLAPLSLSLGLSRRSPSCFASRARLTSGTATKNHDLTLSIDVIPALYRNDESVQAYALVAAWKWY